MVLDLGHSARGARRHLEQEVPKEKPLAFHVKVIGYRFGVRTVWIDDSFPRGASLGNSLYELG
jgi:hypothetical protein